MGRRRRRKKDELRSEGFIFSLSLETTRERNIAEVVISPNRDKRGRMYGFVRFYNMVHVNVMDTKLENLVL